MKIDVLGVKINSDDKNTILFMIKKLLGERQKIFITTPYSEMLVAAQKDKKFCDILNSSTFALPDGIGVLWAAHYLKYRKFLPGLLSIIFRPRTIRDPIPDKISGSDFVWDLTRLAEDRGYSVFLLGGFGDTPQLVAKKFQKKFPNLKIAGAYSGLSFAEKAGSEMTEKAIQAISKSQADFLFVALGPIRQEKWIYENLSNLSVKLAIGLGGTFDYLAGKRVLAPQIWASSGLEWLWRLITQPWRIWRVSRGVLGLIWYSVRKALC